MIIRKTTLEDVAQISGFLQELTALGKRTRPDDEAYVRDYYVNSPSGILCSVADEDGAILGLQSLSRAAVGDEWNLPAGWGVIGTHIKPSAARRGVGRKLFAASLEAARGAGLTHIEASIGADNAEGLAYYEAMGFRTYKTPPGRVCKQFEL